MSIKQLTDCLGKCIIVHKQISEPMVVKYLGLVNKAKYFIAFENGTDIHIGDRLQIENEAEFWEVKAVDTIVTGANETDLRVTISKSQ